MMLVRQAEIFCTSYWDAKQAYRGGASRIILSHYLHNGGLTPSIAELLKIKNNMKMEVICMVRPRPAGYCYRDEDIETMMLDAEILLDNGADGIAFGFLTDECEIDIVHTRKMIELIHTYGKKAIYNQAIDSAEDIDKSMNILITMRTDGIYTSGQQEDIYYGKEMIRYLQEAYGRFIQIVAVYNSEKLNVSQLIEETHVEIVQGLCLCGCIDPTNQQDIANDFYMGDYQMVDSTEVELFVDLVEEEVYEFEWA